jgi:hypothetical protein
MLLPAMLGMVPLLLAQEIIYLSPKPQSTLVSVRTNIILRCDQDVDPGTLAPALLSVHGEKSGSHPGTLTLSDDGQTMLFAPDKALEPGERVDVSLRKGVATLGGSLLDGMTFSFTTSPLRESLTATHAVSDEGEIIARSSPAIAHAVLSTDSDSLPSDFPIIKVDSVNNPSPGYYFLSTAEMGSTTGSFAFMMDNSGKVVKYKRIGHHHVYDFKQQTNGLYSYADGESEWGYAGGSRSIHRIVDSSFTQVDSVRAGNGYDADSHEFRVLPNGHVLLHAYDIQYFDLSGVITGGNPNAIVVGSILQELDLSRNVVFQWRSWDYIPIADTYMSTSASAFDYIHVNAYVPDDDGNILASFRNTCEIVKIDRMTGDIIWRMGGKHNQFTFTGENSANAPTYFTYQHCLVRLANGNFLLFDNGNLHPTKLSRAVEYQVDQVGKTATLVWEYRHTPDIFANARGSVQRLADGNTVIGWGSAPINGVGRQSVTEVRPDKSTAFEMEFMDSTSSYRALKYVLGAVAVPAASVVLYDLLPGNTYNFRRGDSVRTNVSILFTQSPSGYNSVTVKRLGYAPLNDAWGGLPPFVQPQRWTIRQIGMPSFTADVTFDSSAISRYANKDRAILYSRGTEGQGVFSPLPSFYDAQRQTLTATTNAFGEFIIGVPELVGPPAIPAPVAPQQNARLNQETPVLFRWASFGHLTGSHLQVAADSLFSSLVIDDSTLKTSSYAWQGASPGATYFWRAKVRNEQGQSSWSAGSRFGTEPPFIEVVNPRQGDRVVPGTQTLVRWNFNIGSFVAIRLYRNGVFASKIIDSVENTGRYTWRIPAAGLALDSTYSLRVRLLSDSTLYSDSKRFSIASSAGVAEDGSIPSTYSLEQNYPNPFNPVTTISFGLAAKSAVDLSVFNIVGQQVAQIIHREMEAGYYKEQFDASRLSSGVYFYRMQARASAGGPTGYVELTRKLLLVR